MATVGWNIYSGSADVTQALGIRIGCGVPYPLVFAVRGSLGVGKTVFAQGLAAGLGVRDDVNSPTYIYFQEYSSARLPFCHVDAYRLETADAEEKYQIGLEECFDGHAVVLVEWPDFVAEYLPDDYIEMQLTTGNDVLKISFRFDEDKEPWLNALLAEEATQCDC